MKFFQLSAVAALLASAALSASAMTAIDDSALSQVSGQDGVSIAGDLNINIGSFKYTDTGTDGGSVSFNNIGIKGMFVMTVDILNAATFSGAVGTSMGSYLDAAAVGRVLGNTTAFATAQAGYDAKNGAGAFAALTAGQQAVTVELTNLVVKGVYDNASDVVQFAFPNAGLDSKLAPSVTVGSITMGNSTKSFGSVAINNIDLQGTKVWMWAH
ncbi:DUF6160 family protein [Roseateles koreensis]|uniref:DUF6160 family protein n=1 Tax=Roseateles koreensis TaxID=2987526 RepID=A0ABT5KQ55_9BURK|nr:DUF6160 family protein [Roseateles koreensis]MDC8785038.1 DUF6160 family protein [Roseateles koreensis]